MSETKKTQTKTGSTKSSSQTKASSASKSSSSTKASSTKASSTRSTSTRSASQNKASRTERSSGNSGNRSTSNRSSSSSSSFTSKNELRDTIIKLSRKNKKLTIILLVVLAILVLAACVTLYANGYRLEDFIEDQPTSNQPLQSGNKTTRRDDTSYTGTNSGMESSALEIPICVATKEPGKTHKDHEVHTYTGFELCYRESYEGAEWVAYHLTADETKAVTNRTDDFRADTKISTGSATPDDYRGSGYDRGHLAPAADMEWSIDACRDSFLMSNMSPQAGPFNRGLWKTLEEKVRDWARIFGEVWIVTGPVFEKDASSYKTIGKNKVAVPEYYYKVLVTNADSRDDYNSTIAIGFILPNDRLDGSIWDYACSIDEVEERTGLDFFSILPDAVEEKLEKLTDFPEWK